MENNLKLLSIGNYEVSSLTLGEGSFSKVKVARHKVLNKNVAIKIIKKTSIKDSYVAKNLEREAKIMSTLFHKNVARLFEVAKSNGFYCLIMEYCAGGSLCDLVQNTGKVSENKAKFFFRQLLQGLSYIHEKGIIHRDLKLENVLLNKDHSNLVIADFGLSNFWNPGTQLATHCGSPEYAAPELFLKASYTNKIDIWSAGIVLYAMLTAQLPFDVKSGIKHHLKILIKTINSGLVEYHRRKLIHTSIELKLLISKMLCVAPDQRISLENIWKDAWMFEDGEVPQPVKGEDELSEGETKVVIRMCKNKLNLHHTTSEKILSYIRSDNGRLGKTAGCFNLLKKDFEQLKLSAGESKAVKQVDLQPSQLQWKTDTLKALRKSVEESREMRRSDGVHQWVPGVSLLSGESQGTQQLAGSQGTRQSTGGTLRNAEGSQGAFQGDKRSQGTHQTARGSQGTNQNALGSQGTHQIVRGSQGTNQNALGSQGTNQTARGSQGTNQTARGSQGTRQTARGSQGTDPTVAAAVRRSRETKWPHTFFGTYDNQQLEPRGVSELMHCSPVQRKIVGRTIHDVKVAGNTKVLRTPKSGYRQQFWCSSEGKRAVEALKRFNTSSACHSPNIVKSIHSSNSPESKIRRTESREAVTVKRKILNDKLNKRKVKGGTRPAQGASSGTTSVAASSAADQENRDVNTWRRSIRPKPTAEGKQVHTRLKRVDDTKDKGPLTNWDLNRLH